MTAEKVLITPTDTEIAFAVHENLFALFRSMQAIPGCQVVETEHFGLHYAPLSNPMFMGAWKTRFVSDKVDDQIDEVLFWFKQRNAPSFFWWTDIRTQPANLVERLMKRGFEGIGAAMTLIPLLEARIQGCNFGVLFSSRMGYSVYKRLGFREVTNKIGLYTKEWD